MASVTTDRRFGVNVNQAIKVPVSAVAATNITLDGGTTTTVDGVTMATDYRILCVSQTDASENGIYLWRSGAFVRAPDFDGTYDVVGGTIIPVVLGDTYADSLWYVNNTYGTVTIDTDNISFGILAWGWANLSLTNSRILKAGTNGAPADTLWSESTAGGTISPVSTHQVIRDNNIQGYFETVQTVTSSTAAALQFALRDGNVIYHLLTQNTTLQVPSDWPTSSGNAASFTMHISQNATNGYTLSYSTAAAQIFEFGDGTTHGMSTGSNAVDTITGYGLGSTAPTLYMITAITGGSSYT